MCNGQTLLCKSIGLKVKEWDCQKLSSELFRLDISKENSEPPTEIIQTTRLGIPKGRDENLPYRFIHSGKDFLKYGRNTQSYFMKLLIRKDPRNIFFYK